ncbi:MAG TPA: hypothetical protein VD999_05670 [Vitreimonas sp.]|nr:hypothetical protein [Vitreimonas sp.]
MEEKYLNYVHKNGYVSGYLFNLVVYAIIYKLFGVEWLIVFGIAHINTDQDWTNILLFKNKKKE